MSRPDLTLVYGPLPDQVVDVRLPATSSAPASPSLVVVVHGGFWKAEWDRSHAGDQSAALAAAGYVVATVEYRRVSRSGDGWPATFDDVALLVDTVPDLVAAAVPGLVAGGVRTVLVGHSAGGHLATWAASRHRLPVTSRWHRATAAPVAVVSLAGVVDLALADELGLGGHAARVLLGGSPAEHPHRWAQADPATLAPVGVPVVLVHGDQDEAVPVEVSRSYLAAARGFGAAGAGGPAGAGAASVGGAAVALHELAGVDHMALVDPTSSAWPAVVSAVALAAVG